MPTARRTQPYSNATDAMPSTAWGSRMLHEDIPNIRIDSAIGHSASGGLSTVMALAGSNEPKSMAFHDSEPAKAAAE